MKETSYFHIASMTADKYSLWGVLGEESRSEFGIRNPLIVKASPGDRKYEMVRSLVHRMFKEGNEDDSPSWWCERSYTAAELQEAELFLMRFPNPGEIAGKQVVYDWSGCCQFWRCEAGRRQTAPLRFRLNRLPKSRPLIMSLDREWLMPAATAELLRAEKLTGFELERVENDDTAGSGEPVHVPAISELSRYTSGRELLRRAEEAGVNLEVVSYPWCHTRQPVLWEYCVGEHNEWLRLQNPKPGSKSPPKWYQLRVTSKPLPVCPPAAFGNNPFDLDLKGWCRCPHGIHGHTNGLKLVTEVHVNRADWDGNDIVATSNLVGLRGGDSVPEPLLLVSPRFRRLVLSLKPKGIVFEIARFTDPGTSMKE